MFACGQKRLLLPWPCLSYPVHLQPDRALSAVCACGYRTSCETKGVDWAEFFASGWLTWLKCTTQGQWDHLDPWPLSIVPFDHRGGPRRGDFELINVVFNECLNVETWPTPAYGSYIYTPTTRPVGLKSNGGRARIW